MKAVQLLAPRRMDIVNVPEPTRARGQILVRMEHVSVCGSDLHRYRGRPPCDPFPMAPGKPAHECLGRVVRSDGAGGFREGEIVLVRPPLADGLKELVAVGPTDLHPTEGFRLSPEEALMGQLLAPVVHCCKRLGPVRGKSVFIIGQGPAGLMLTNMMKLGGAKLIVTSDPVADRLRESLRRGASHVMEPSPGILAQAAELTGSRMFDIVIEAVGEDETISLAPRLAKDRGLVMFFGLPGLTAQLALREFFSKQLRITTTEFPDRSDFNRALAMISNREIEVASMITHRFPFHRAPEAFRLADERSDGILRAVLTFEPSEK